MKDFVKIGTNTWVNPGNVVRVALAKGEPPRVTVLFGDKTSIDYTGDDAEDVLEALGHGREVRTKEAEERAKAAAARDATAVREAAHAARADEEAREQAKRDAAKAAEAQEKAARAAHEKAANEAEKAGAHPARKH